MWQSGDAMKTSLTKWAEKAWDEIKPKPIVCLPLMTKPAREVEKATKYLPDVWMPPCR
jgi:hypothetical protein